MKHEARKRGQAHRSEIDIVKRLTNAADGQITMNDNGFMSRTYLVDSGRIVFKFPKTDAGKKEYAREVPALSLLKQHSFGVRVPVIHWVSPDHDYIGYFGIPASSTLQETIFHLSEMEKKKIGMQIGLFLKQLHAICPVKELDVKTAKDEVSKYQDRYKMALPVLRTYFSDAELHQIDAFFRKELPETMDSLGEDLVFSHGDLGLYNIMLSEDNEPGMIDFGDAALFDRSKDFVSLEDERIRESAIIAYGDSDLLRRKIQIRTKALPALELYYYISIDDQKGIEKWVALLKAGLGMENQSAFL